MHDLPPRFNSDMLTHCQTLSQWTDMCRFTSNSGLGPPLNNKPRWYRTNQFSLDVIFHNRMKHYSCLTSNSSMASAIYVPFYAGLDVARYLWGSFNVSVRDSASLDLINWLKTKPEWTNMGGKDHFLVAGRITWDFRRLTDEDKDWGNKLLLLPEVKNMSVLVIESSPWHSNDFGVPYPTYFHPCSEKEVVEWQERMRRVERKWLFAFVGAPRVNQMRSIRGKVLEQCGRSEKCALVRCAGSGGGDHQSDQYCHEPERVMEVFERSVFCLQPQGDSYTRRSAFDAMVAGCVPVFFHPGSAYVQYGWHLDGDYRKYSVFISEEDVRDEKVRIEEVLGGIQMEDVERMREEVIGMIPRLVYGDPRCEGIESKDAFDLAVEGVVNRVGRVRRGIEDGGGVHEWDHFFS
ncbi:Exostosin-like protein [Dioscorea alata]|uniref:Exostosin-like protein n=1 Tax=Dioscorea alata TaxID=55571 RepID=A0ACB7VU76_DIOAL|nr:Exostosin-like protein [Dioscorea alata]